MTEAGKEFASWKQSVFKIRHSVVGVGLGQSGTRECGRERTQCWNQWGSEEQRVDVLEDQACILKQASLIQSNAFLLFGRNTISDFELVEVYAFI